MLEILKGREVKRSFENIFFRDFSAKLHELFERRGFNGILLGYPECADEPTLQIDALLITERVICIIDFKNYGGTIQLPGEENFGTKEWVNIIQSPVHIKGGSKINPFVQLKEQKRKFTKLVNELISKELPSDQKIAAHHVVTAACFQQPVILNGYIPKKHEIVFFIMDSINYLEKLEDIIDVKDSSNFIGPSGFEVFKKYFKTDSSYRSGEPSEETELKSHLMTLRVDQSAAITAMEKFLVDPEKKVFILSGTTNSGKTHLIPAINKMATLNGIDAVVNMVPNAKIASKMVIPGVEIIDNIYGYIYNFRGVRKQEDQNDENKTSFHEETEVDSDINTEVIPVRKSDDAFNALYIVDDAHMITDNLIADELLRFGTGHLLGDLLEFCDLDNTERKLIFLGDQFQVSYGRNDLSAISSEFMQLKCGNKVELVTLNDNPAYSTITDKALICVEALRDEKFSKLDFPQNGSMMKMNKETLLDELTKTRGMPPNTIILTFTNGQAYFWNKSIKEIVTPGMQDLAVGDIIVFHNAVKGISPTDKSLYRYIQNKQFAVIQKTDDSMTRELQVEFKKQNYQIVIKEITINLLELTEDLKIHYLESFFLGNSRIKDMNEMKAIQKLKGIELNKFRNANPFINSPEFTALSRNEEYLKLYTVHPETCAKMLASGRKVKSSDSTEQKLINMLSRARSQYLESTMSSLENDPDSIYHILGNLALIKYGWALTVYRAIPEKWFNVYLIANSRQGKYNQEYFRLVYSGISRAKIKMVLVDFQAVSPYLNTKIRESEQGNKLLDLFISVPEEKLEYVPELLRKRLMSLFSNSCITVKNINSSSYQERYRFDLKDDFVEASFSYTGKGLISYPKFTKYSNEAFKSMIDKLIKEPIDIEEEELNIPDWRKEEYLSLAMSVALDGIKCTAIISNNWQDTLVLTGINGRLVSCQA
ncbi:MAG: nuclease-related domain-containing protein [Candidatus Cloacimonadaceae bacterium]|jgi:hypothetical protein|nr:NERD domain-containing protein [Candidatus Cloacimonadota bacterium]MDX9950219.1 nuclease-related domain-containing protein [Candidatus Syntrophosphaera sp.]